MKIVKNVVRTLVLSALALVAVFNSQVPEKNEARVETIVSTKAITAMSAAVVADESAN